MRGNRLAHGTGPAIVIVNSRNVTVEGTVATSALDELTFTVSPDAGAAPERVSVRPCVAVPEMVRLSGVKLMVALT